MSRIPQIGILVVSAILLSGSIGYLLGAAPSSAPNTLIDDEGLEAYKVNGIRYANPDDVTSIQDAIDDLTSTGGLIIIPGGNYAMGTSTIAPTSNIALVGVGRQTHLTWTGLNTYGIEVEDESHVVVRDMWLTGGGNAEGTGSGITFTAGSNNCTADGVYLDQWPNDVINLLGPSDHHLVTDCVAWNCDEGINVRGVSYCIITNNRIDACNDGIEVGDRQPYSKNATGNIISNNVVTNTTGVGGYGIWVTGRVNNTIISGNTVSGGVLNYGLYVTASSSSYYPSDLIVSDNSFLNVGYAGIGVVSCDYWEHFVFDSNDIIGTGAYGIQVDAEGRDLLISNNLISGVDFEGSNGMGVRINACGSNVSIIGNLIMDIDDYCIYTTGTDGVSIADNTVNGGSNGIYVAGATYGLKIDGNQIAAQTSYGVNLAGTPAAVSVVNNLFRSTTEAGVYIGVAWADIQIDGNLFEDMKHYGVYASGAGDGLSIHGNYFESVDYGGGNGMAVRVSGTGQNISITANNVGSADDYGFYLTTLKNVIVATNHIQSSAKGIYFTGSNMTFLGNDIWATTNAVECADSSYNMFLGNRLVGVQKGIYTTGTSDYNFVIANNFWGCATNYTLAGSNNVVYDNIH